MSTLNVDKVDPNTGTALELGTSGDTITVPTGAGLTVTDEVKTNKVSPATGTAFALGDSGDTFTVPSGATIVNSGTATGFGITAASFVPTATPLIINGNMEVAQRGTSQAAVASNGGYKTVDRWQNNNQGSYIGDLTNTQSTDVPDGFSKSYKYDCTTADASPSANSSVFFEQRIEAQNCMLFKLGTSDAEIMTLSFWVKATKTGTNIVRIEQEDDQRQCSQAYTVDSTDTWEKKVVTFPADTSGSGITSDNGIGLEVWFYVAAGTTYTSGTLATTWEAVSGNDDNKAVGQVNNQDSTSNDFLITGVQLEVGEYTSSTIPPFQHEGYGDNLMRCLRYYEGIEFLRKTSVCYSGTAGGSYWVCDADIVIKRDTPTNTFNISSMTGFTITGQGSSYYDRGNIAVTWLTGYPVGTAVGLTNSSHATGYINCDAEL